MNQSLGGTKGFIRDLAHGLLRLLHTPLHRLRFPDSLGSRLDLLETTATGTGTEHIPHSQSGYKKYFAPHESSLQYVENRISR
jgi:hypothetical protein